MNPDDKGQGSENNEPVKHEEIYAESPLLVAVGPEKPKWFRRYKKQLIMLAVVVVFGGVVYSFWGSDKGNNNAETARESNQQSSEPVSEVDKFTGMLQLDPSKQYGNKYKSGVVPVGDGKYVTDAPKKGHIYLCQNNFVKPGQAGAQTRGPWFVNETHWNIYAKYAVYGDLSWTHDKTIEFKDGKRIISTNSLPAHPTGIFPLSLDDPASLYDRNPNSIKQQSLTYALAADPTLSSAPKCMGGEVGVMLTGAALFNAFDAGGRDAGAWEIQDECEGHPESSGRYHYHSLSSCIKDTKVDSVIGFALDGFPITGPKIDDRNYLTSSDLDECHGIVSEIMLDGKKVKTYHYVMTVDFPYSVSCFRGTPEQSPDKHPAVNSPLPR
jgi:hypothetical protein